jgi:hypothetical protein
MLLLCVEHPLAYVQDETRDPVSKMLEEWLPYTNIKSSSVALFSSGEFAQSLILLLNLRDASQENLAKSGYNGTTRRTLKDLLIAHMVFSGLGLIITLLLLALGGIHRGVTQGRTPMMLQRATEQCGLATRGELGWLCKWLNALTMVCAFATMVLSTAVASYRTSPTPLG